jgi:aminoglycoside phosphotransferase family enzyme/predicted kinase
VFIGAERVWKLRKAVRLAYVDFTTLAARRAAAEREIALNSAHAPGLYQGMRLLTRGAEGLAFDGDGPAVDAVTEMALVPAGDFMDARAEAGELEPGLLDALADGVAAWHATSAVVVRDQVAALAEVIAGNARAALAAGLDAADVEAWLAAAMAVLGGMGPWLAGRAGRLRRLHGDLHLGNIVMWRGVPAPIDALEFDEDLACFDVGYDLAFLLMDLEARCGRAAANRVLNRFVARDGDAGLVVGLPLFLSLRAMIRAHIAATRGDAGAGAAGLARARAYLLPGEGFVLAIGGLPGAGKSTVARLVAAGIGAAPGALVLRSDEIRKRQHGVVPEVRLGPEAYTRAASEGVFRELAAMAAAARGHGVVADATFMNKAHRAMLREAAGDVPFLGVWLTAAPEVLRARVAARRGDASDADLRVVESALRGDPGAGDWVQVDATDAEAASGAILDALRGDVRQ